MATEEALGRLRALNLERASAQQSTRPGASHSPSAQTS
jgi:hypothetical protein